MKPDKKNIKGVNLGSWLLMEGYILGGPNIAETAFKRRFIDKYGKGELQKFETLFRDNFIKEDDFKQIASLGANTVRVPFNYRLLETKPYTYCSAGFSYLDKALQWAHKHGLRVILDLHAACGSQNCDWHADSTGSAELWRSRACQERTYALWEVIADRYKDSPGLEGYDFLNEPVLGKLSTNILKKFYKTLIKSVKAVDKTHTIFLEGDVWSQRIGFLRDLIDDNISLSIHTYQPLNFTFNFSRFSSFPGTIDKIRWDKKRIYDYIKPYYEFSKKNNVDIFVGEFGINWRGGFWGEQKWLECMLNAFTDFGFGYTYWTYKAMANSLFPDGLYQYLENSRYINRQGPARGWETYLEFWKNEKGLIRQFWHSKNFTENKILTKALGRFFSK